MRHGICRRLRSRWFPPPALLLLLLVLLLLVLSLYPRLPHGLHARCSSRLLKFAMPPTERLQSKRNCSSRRHLQNKSDRVRLTRRRGKIAITHTHLHVHTPRHAALYTICHLYTHTRTYTKRGESSKLRRGFVPLMNLQRDSTESPFTYMYVINTTYYSRPSR
jgi:hypothetical protein